MKLTESQLKNVIRKVIQEQAADQADHEDAIIHCLTMAKDGSFIRAMKSTCREFPNEVRSLIRLLEECSSFDTRR